MGLQLIFVLETNKKCKSDWIYIKETISYFYKIDCRIKLSDVYMDGKGNYQKRRNEIEQLKKQYQRVKGNKTIVLYCFDCDDYDINQDDKVFLDNVKKYCENNGYEFVWFCKDIERVYIGKKVDRHQKKKEAENFKIKRMMDEIDANKLYAKYYQRNTSNLLTILDFYLKPFSCR